MTESKNDDCLLLESKIENMLDKLIESDEELENNEEHSSLKFSEDISSSEDNKEEKNPFEKELFNTEFFQNEDNSQSRVSNLTSKSSFDISNEQNTQTPFTQKIQPKMNLVYNNSNPFPFNYLYSQQINNLNVN